VDSGVDREMAEAVELGQSNQEMIRRAKAWCTNLRFSKGVMGVGLIEQMTGLPVSGGAFGCDHATSETSVQGMDLVSIALTFYTGNCRGCKNREPTIDLDNMGVWAELIIASDQEKAAVDLERAQQSSDASVARSTERRRLLGVTDAETQAILDLMDKVDAANPSGDAQRTLLNHAKLHPRAFTPDIRAALLADGREHLIGGFIATELALALDDGERAVEGSVPLALWALEHGLATDEALRVVAGGFRVQHAPEAAGAFAEIRWRAAPPSFGGGFGRLSPHPEALLRMFEHSPDWVTSRLQQDLANPDPATRASAAAACEQLIRGSQGPIEALLRPLVGALGVPDESKYGGDPFPIARAEEALTAAYRLSPGEVEDVLETAWEGADASVRRQLLGVYDKMLRKGMRDELPQPAVRRAVSRALATITADGTSNDALREAADLLGLAFRYHSYGAGVDVGTLIGYLALLKESIATLEAADASSTIGILEQQTRLMILRNALRRLEEAIATVLKEDPEAFASSFSAVWDGLDSEDPIRRSLVRVAAQLIRDPRLVSIAVPYLVAAATGPDTVQRAEALGAFADVADIALLPDDVNDVVSGALADRFLMVVEAAIQAAARLGVPDHLQEAAIGTALAVATQLAGDRLSADRARQALSAAQSLASGGELAAWTADQVLRVIEGMPIFDAREALSRLSGLESSLSWADQAVRALGRDPEPGWDSLGDSERERLLFALMRHSDQVLARRDSILDVGTSDLQWGYEFSWQIVDLLAECGAWNSALLLARTIVDTVPDTTEKTPLKRFFQGRLGVVVLEAGVAEGDKSRLDDSLREAKSLMHPDHAESEAGRVECREAAIAALRGALSGEDSAHALDEAAAAIRSVPGGRQQGDAAWAYAEMLEVVAMGVRWGGAVRSGEQDADRFVRAAKLRARQVLVACEGSLSENLVEAAAAACELTDTDQIGVVAQGILSAAIPTRVSRQVAQALEPRVWPGVGNVQTGAVTPVVLVLISVDGSPLQSPLLVQKDTVHTVEIELRLASWPADATSLVLSFRSMLPETVLRLGPVYLRRDQLRAECALVMTAGTRAGTFQVVTEAVFKLADGSDLTAQVVGHPSWWLAGHDSATALPLGLPTASQALFDVMSAIDVKVPSLPVADRDAVQVMSESLLRFSNLVSQDGALRGTRTSERDFQTRLKNHMVADPGIGARLQEAPRLGGGITDLKLETVILELKVEHDKSVSIDDADQYISQAAHYGSGVDAPVSVLCILDDSPKTRPLGVMRNYIGILEPRLHGLEDPRYPSLVVVVIVPVGFPRPSDWSRG